MKQCTQTDRTKLHERDSATPLKANSHFARGREVVGSWNGQPPNLTEIMNRSHCRAQTTMWDPQVFSSFAPFPSDSPNLSKFQLATNAKGVVPFHFHLPFFFALHFEMTKFWCSGVRAGRLRLRSFRWMPAFNRTLRIASQIHLHILQIFNRTGVVTEHHEGDAMWAVECMGVRALEFVYFECCRSRWIQSGSCVLCHPHAWFHRNVFVRPYATHINSYSFDSKPIFSTDRAHEMVFSVPFDSGLCACTFATEPKTYGFECECMVSARSHWSRTYAGHILLHVVLFTALDIRQEWEIRSTAKKSRRRERGGERKRRTELTKCSLKAFTAEWVNDLRSCTTYWCVLN